MRPSLLQQFFSTYCCIHAVCYPALNAIKLFCLHYKAKARCSAAYRFMPYCQGLPEGILAYYLQHSRWHPYVVHVENIHVLPRDHSVVVKPVCQNCASATATALDLLTVPWHARSLIFRFVACYRALAVFKAYIDQRQKFPFFSNARTVSGKSAHIF